MIINQSFHEHEYKAWLERASYYDEIFADMTKQVIAPILDKLGNLQGRRLLDVACGTGHLVGAASKRGADSEGIDFAETMIDVASANYPANTFRVSDATALPYEDATFDAVTCAFGLLHMEYPQRALDEAFRVLKLGGIFVFALWDNSENGLHALTKPALSTYGTPISLPDSWTQLRNPDEDSCKRLTDEAGFLPPQFETLPFVLKIEDASYMLSFIQKLSIRTKLLIESQPENVKRKIYDRIMSDANQKKVDGVISLGFPALVTCVQKPEWAQRGANNVKTNRDEAHIL